MAATMNRRALIGATGLAAVVMATPVAGYAQQSDGAWRALVAAYEQTDTRLKAIGREHDQRFAAYTAELPSLGAKPEKPVTRLPRRLAEMTMAEFQAFADAQDSGEAQAKYDADLAAWKVRDAALEQRTVGDVDARWEAALDAHSAAEKALLAHPAPHAAALAYKIDVAERSYKGFDLDETIARQIFADTRRLLSMEA